MNVQIVDIAETCPDSINGSFIGSHGPISTTARVTCENLRDIIERRSDGTRPAPGDIVILNGHNSYHKKDVTYRGGHIEGETDGRLNMCTQPMTPHVTKNGGMDTSGGYWLGADSDQLEHVGTEVKMFWTWGGCRTANGGVNFFAIVNVWEHTDTENIY